MALFHQFRVFAESRAEGLHPKRRSLLECAVASPFSEVSMRDDGLIRAGPSRDSDAVSSRANVVLVSRELTTPVAAAPELKLRRLSKSKPKQEHSI
jgi:hypothetical protein